MNKEQIRPQKLKLKNKGCDRQRKKVICPTFVGKGKSNSDW